MEVEWDALGAVAELIGGVGVIATLFYLASQIRRNTRATYAETYQRFTDSINSTNQLIASDPDLARMIALAGTKEFDDFDALDRVRLSHVLLCSFRALESLFYHRSEGAATDRAWKSQAIMIKDVVRYPAVRTWWPLNAAIFDHGFRDFVDKAIAEVREGELPPKWFGAVEAEVRK
jgi:hypothetical protein